MTITPTSVAIAVTALLSAADLGVPAAVNRSYAPVYRLEEIKSLTLTVVPKSEEETLATRKADQFVFEIDVAVQQKLSRPIADEQAEIDGLMDLVRQVKAVFRRQPLPGLPAVFWVGSKNDPTYLPDHLKTNRVFTSVITLTYKTIQE